MSKYDDLGKGMDVSEHSRVAVVGQDHITWKSKAYIAWEKAACRSG